MWRRVSAGSYPPLVTAATVWKTVDTEKSPVRTAPYTRLQYSWAAPGTGSVSGPGLGWVWCGVGTCGAGDHEVAQPDGGDH